MLPRCFVGDTLHATLVVAIRRVLRRLWRCEMTVQHVSGDDVRVVCENYRSTRFTARSIHLQRRLVGPRRRLLPTSTRRVCLYTRNTRDSMPSTQVYVTGSNDVQTKLKRKCARNCGPEFVGYYSFGLFRVTLITQWDYAKEISLWTWADWVAVNSS